MPDIKTRDIAKGTIKTIDKSAVAAERMKSAFIQTKEKAEHSVDVPESSAEEYASNRLESGIDRVSHEAVHQFDKQGRKGVQATKQNIVKAKDGIQKFKEKRAAQSLQKQAQAAAPRKGVGQSIKAVEQPKKAVKETARSAGKKTIMDYIAGKHPDLVPLYDEIYNKHNRSYFEALEVKAEEMAKKYDCTFVDNEMPYGRVPQGHPVIVDYFYHEEIRGTENTGKRNRQLQVYQAL